MSASANVGLAIVPDANGTHTDGGALPTTNGLADMPSDVVAKVEASVPELKVEQKAEVVETEAMVNGEKLTAAAQGPPVAGTGVAASMPDRSPPAAPGVAPKGHPADVRMASILRQVEYYFSDENLPRDRFLRSKMAENDDGWVDISVIVGFNKMRALNATVACLRAAISNSALVVAEEDADRVKRTTPMPDTPDWRTRALYAKGWVADGPEPLHVNIEEMFKPYGKVLAVKMRRWTGDDGTRHFKGSVFVEFETAEAVERAVADTHSIKIKEPESESEVDKELIVLDVETYFEKKREEAKERTKKFKERKAAKKALGASAASTNNGGQDAPQRTFEKGLILFVSSIGEGVSREDIKELIEPHAHAAWIDFERGGSEGHVRFGTADASTQAVMGLTGKEMGGKVVELRILQDEEEDSYWKKVWEQQDRNRQSKKRSRDGGDRGGGYKRARGRGRGRGRRGRH